MTHVFFLCGTRGSPTERVKRNTSYTGCTRDVVISSHIWFILYYCRYFGVVRNAKGLVFLAAGLFLFSKHAGQFKEYLTREHEVGMIV